MSFPITKVEGTADQLKDLRRVLGHRQLSQSALIPAIEEAIKLAKVNETAEVDESELTDKGLQIMYRAWSELGNGRYKPLGEATRRMCAKTW